MLFFRYHPSCFWRQGLSLAWSLPSRSAAWPASLRNPLSLPPQFALEAGTTTFRCLTIWVLGEGAHVLILARCLLFYSWPGRYVTWENEEVTLHGVGRENLKFQYIPKTLLSMVSQSSACLIQQLIANGHLPYRYVHPAAFPAHPASWVSSLSSTTL